MPKTDKVSEVFPHNHDTTPISVGRVWLDHYARQRGGAICPCCDRTKKHTEFKLNSQLARLLILCYRCYRPGHIVNVKELLAAAQRDFIKGREWNKLGYWELLIPVDASGAPTTKPTDLGMLTDRGQQFVYNNLHVVKTVWVHDHAVASTSSTVVNIQKALGKRQDYNVLINEMYPFQEQAHA